MHRKGACIIYRVEISPKAIQSLEDIYHIDEGAYRRILVAIGNLGHDRRPDGSELINFSISIADRARVTAGGVAGKWPFRYLGSLLGWLLSACTRRRRHESAVALARAQFATVAKRLRVRYLMKLRVNQFDVNYTVHDDPPVVRVTMVYDRANMVAAARHYCSRGLFGQ